jgi:hypothetical protein
MVSGPLSQVTKPKMKNSTPMMIIGIRFDVRDSSAASEMDDMDDFPVMNADATTPWAASLRQPLSTAWRNVVN